MNNTNKDETMKIENPSVVDETIILENSPVKEETMEIKSPSVMDETIILENSSVREETMEIKSPSVMDETIILENPSIIDESIAVEYTRKNDNDSILVTADKQEKSQYEESQTNKPNKKKSIVKYFYMIMCLCILAGLGYTAYQFYLLEQEKDSFMGLYEEHVESELELIQTDINSYRDNLQSNVTGDNYYALMQEAVSYYDDILVKIAELKEKVEDNESIKNVGNDSIEDILYEIEIIEILVSGYQEETINDISRNYIFELSGLIVKDTEGSINSLNETLDQLYSILDLMVEDELKDKYLEMNDCIGVYDEVIALIEQYEGELERISSNNNLNSESQNDQDVEEEDEEESLTTGTTTDSNSSNGSDSSSNNSSSNDSSTDDESVTNDDVVLDDSESDDDVSTENNNATIIVTDTVAEAQMLASINEERTKLGLPTFEYNSSIYEVAEIRANELVELFAYARPNGETLESLGINLIAENICYSGGDHSGYYAVDLFMKSDTNKGNILSSDVSKFACKRVVENGVAYWVQIFAN